MKFLLERRELSNLAKDIPAPKGLTLKAQVHGSVDCYEEGHATCPAIIKKYGYTDENQAVEAYQEAVSEQISRGNPDMYGYKDSYSSKLFSEIYGRYQIQIYRADGEIWVVVLDYS